MALIELRQEKLVLGMSLNFTLRDEKNVILLAKGQRIESAQQLDSIRSRKKIYIEIDETQDGVRAMMAGLNALTHAGGAIKDISTYVELNQAPAAEEKPTGTLADRWGALESKLGAILANVGTGTDFVKKVYDLDRQIQDLMAEGSTASQFLLFNRAVTHFRGYSVLHALLCATLAHSLRDMFALSENERRSLVCAALTMNVAMTHLQDMLAVQKEAPTPSQKGEIERHAAKGRQILLAAGVADPVWLEIISLHHSPLEGPELLADWSPVKRLTKILQTLDRYTAAMSPRKSRSGRTARDSSRSVVLQTGGTKHDEVGAALFRKLGMCPPGTYVKLVSGETAVVICRGEKPVAPLVASVLNRHDEPIAEPRLHDTALENHAIQSTLLASSVRVNLKMDAMCRLIPK